MSLRLVLPLIAALLGAASPSSSARAADASRPDERAPLWPGPAPVGDGTLDTNNAYITVHRAPKPNGASIVICPGGGYGGLVTGAEGHGIAQWLNGHGIGGIVLEYRLPHGRARVPLLDAQRALRVVRANARAWELDPARVGIMGFSAGGHLASTAATRFDDGDSPSTDPIARFGCRPDFAILVYPVISFGPKGHSGSRDNLLGANASPGLVDAYSNEKQVTGRTSPTYLAHALDDHAVPAENSAMFYRELRDHKVPSEYLELPSGDHGLDGYKGPMWDAWQSGSLKWLASLKLIPAADTVGRDAPAKNP